MKKINPTFIGDILIEELLEFMILELKIGVNGYDK